MNLLETHKLTIGYRHGNVDKTLQESVDLELHPGEIISLMGQNGVGKTTFLKTISGLIPALKGEIKLQGDPLHKLSTKQIAQRMSVVLTEKPFAHNISVLELIAIGRHPYSNWLGMLNQKDKDAIEWAFNETNINYLADKKLYELSDGQFQKVMIARALAQETDLIVLDEPTAHLDLHNKIEVMTLLRQISANGKKGVLISTHDLQICTQLSDRLWLFNFNSPPQQGLPEDLILSGDLEKTLYLADYGYDMIYGTVNQESGPKKVKITGNDPHRYWTIQALKRFGFSHSDDGELVISCQENGWKIQSGENLDSLESLIQKLISG